MCGPCGELGRVNFAVARDMTPNSTPVARDSLASGGFVVVVWRVVVHGHGGLIEYQSFQSVDGAETVESP